MTSVGAGPGWHLERLAGGESFGERGDDLGDDARPSRQERWTAGAPSACTPTTRIAGIDRASDRAGTEHAAAAAYRDEEDVELGHGLKQLERGCRHPGDQYAARSTEWM